MAEGIVHLILLKSWNIAQKLSVEHEESTKKPKSAELGFSHRHKIMNYKK